MSDKADESWCLITFCPRHGPIRGDIKYGIYICEEHWKVMHEEKGYGPETAEEAELEEKNFLAFTKALGERHVRK